MKFNPDLIQKARKGEIAILNDGSYQELLSVCNEVWHNYIKPSGDSKYYFADSFMSPGWRHDNEINIPFKSAKDFFMPDTKDLSDVPAMSVEQPRTYKVTRGQMKEIWEVLPAIGKEAIHNYAKNHVPPFDNEIEVDQYWIAGLVSHFPNSDAPELIKKLFPEQFYIPEGEAVLCRDNLGSWVIGVSDGKGKAYVTFNYNHPQSYGQIIPFTKNPPQ